MDKIKDMEKLIDQQNIKIKELQDKVEVLKDFIERLIVCKQYNAKYPYYEFILNYSITPEQQCKISLLLGLVSEILEGNTLPYRDNETVGFSIDYLYKNEPIKYSDIEKTIKEIILIDDEDGEISFSLIKSIRDQGIQVKLCEYLLSQTTRPTSL